MRLEAVIPMRMSESPSLEQPRFLSIEVENPSLLGERVHIQLDPTRTLLVGRNGAGKSLLMESIARGVRAIFFQDVPKELSAFRCEISRPDAPPLAYEYTQTTLDATSSNLSDREHWVERCWEVRGQECWSVKDGGVSIRGSDIRPWPAAMGLLFSGERSFPEVREEILVLRKMLLGVHLISSGLRRAPRQSVAIPIALGLPTPRPVFDDAVDLSRWIIGLQRESSELYIEVLEVLKSLGIAKEISIETYRAQSNTRIGTSQFSTVMFDGANLEFQSDGVLRVVKIVLSLLREGTTCLLLEEPELAIHPGLLGRLLALMESYSLDRQIILTIHSPQVVNWCSASQLRLIERIENITRVRSIEESQMSRITQYLNDQGTLADFLYGGAIES